MLCLVAISIDIRHAFGCPCGEDGIECSSPPGGYLETGFDRVCTLLSGPMIGQIKSGTREQSGMIWGKSFRV